MKLQEICPKKGTYVGLRVLNPSNQQIYAHCLATGIDVNKSMFDKRLHTTLIYSRKFCPNIKIDTDNSKHICEFIGYDIFGDGEEKILVIKLNAPSVTARHLKLMAENNATYDYPIFQPHITLSYNYTGKDILDLPVIDFDIILGEEYVEDLKLNWAENE